MQISLNNKILINTLLLPKKKVNFCTVQRVADEIRGYLVYKKRQWHFIGPSQFEYMYAGDIELQKIAFILESPHKDEYDDQFHPIRPANGKTGAKIASALVKRRALIGNLKNSVAYEIFIMNPVQYQASCYRWIKKRYCRSNTDKVFRALFNKNKGNQRNDFISRLNAYNPDIVFCCCTSNLKNIVKNAIDNSIAVSKPYYSDCHPSVW